MYSKYPLSASDVSAAFTSLPMLVHRFMKRLSSRSCMQKKDAVRIFRILECCFVVTPGRGEIICTLSCPCWPEPEHYLVIAVIALFVLQGARSKSPKMHPLVSSFLDLDSLPCCSRETDIIHAENTYLNALHTPSPPSIPLQMTNESVAFLFLFRGSVI